MKGTSINDVPECADDGSPAGENPPANRHDGDDVASDIAKMLERQLVVYSSHRLSHLAERVKMPLNDVKALEIVMALEVISTGQLAHLLGVSSGGATALINRLETDGYIVREQHAIDRRIIVIRPKPGGLPELPNAASLANEHVDQSVCRYDLEQLEIVQNFLSRYARLLKDETMQWMESGLHH